MSREIEVTNPPTSSRRQFLTMAGAGANRMERTRSLDRCGSQTLKVSRMSKREQMIRPASSSITESVIAG